MTEKETLDAYIRGLKDGRKEVLDWIKENNAQPDEILDKWQEKLKEWL
jgi:hypothetical protein